MFKKFYPSELPIEIPRRDMLFLFIVETSERMTGEEMEQANEAIYRLVTALKETQEKEEGDIRFNISILAFDSAAHWIQDPVPVAEYRFDPLTASGQQANLAAALDETMEQLSRSKKLLNGFKYKMGKTQFFLVTHGHFEDSSSERTALDQLYTNRWFINGDRFILLTGNNAKDDPKAAKGIARFVPNEEDGIKDMRHIEEFACYINRIMNMTMGPTDIHFYPTTEEDSVSWHQPMPAIPSEADFPSCPDPDSDPFSDLFPGSFN